MLKKIYVIIILIMTVFLGVGISNVKATDNDREVSFDHLHEDFSDFRFEVAISPITWDDEGYEAYRPDEVLIEIYKDGSLLTTLTLSKSNNYYAYYYTNFSSKEEINGLYTIKEVEAKEGDLKYYTTKMEIRRDDYANYKLTITNTFSEELLNADEAEEEIIQNDEETSGEPAQIVNVPSTFASNLKMIGIGVVLMTIAGMIIYIITHKRKTNK